MDVVHAVNFQPVSLTGRMGKSEREKYRITVPDCVQRIEEQTNGEVTVDDWFPVPSCMPLTNVIEAFSSKLNTNYLFTLLVVQELTSLKMLTQRNLFH